MYPEEPSPINVKLNTAPWPSPSPSTADDTMVLETTARPVLDMDTSYNLALGETRAAILRWRTRATPDVERVVDAFRAAQIKKIGQLLGSSREAAEAEAEDPSPYEKEHIFYCLTPPKSYASRRG